MLYGSPGMPHCDGYLCTAVDLIDHREPNNHIQGHQEQAGFTSLSLAVFIDSLLKGKPVCCSSGQNISSVGMSCQSLPPNGSLELCNSLFILIGLTACEASLLTAWAF